MTKLGQEVLDIVRRMKDATGRRPNALIASRKTLEQVVFEPGERIQQVDGALWCGLRLGVSDEYGEGFAVRIEDPSR
jgi:hypothetical protein